MFERQPSARDGRGWQERQDEEERHGIGEFDDSWASKYRGHGPRGYVRSDRRIHEDIADRLSDDPRIDATDVEVQVFEGEVTLSGTVDRRADRRLAEDLADAVSGVRHIANNLRVRERDRSAASAER